MASEWKAVMDGDGDHAIFAGDELIAVTDGWQYGNTTKRTMEQDAAHANLIAAAPQLLEALNCATEALRLAEAQLDFKAMCKHGSLVEFCRAVQAKAEGQ